MADVAGQRTALKNRAAAVITDVKWHDRRQDITHMPAGVVERIEGPELMGLSAIYRTLYHVILIAGPTLAAKRSGAKLDTYLATTGASSFVAAIDQDRTLGGAVIAALVGAPFEDEAYPVNGTEQAATRIPVEVISA